MPMYHENNYSGDVSNRWIVKILLFLHYSSSACIDTYIQLYFKSLKFSEEQIGILGAINSATTFFSAPCWGILMDTVKLPKLFMNTNFILASILKQSILLGTSFSSQMALNFTTSLLGQPIFMLLDNAILNGVRRNPSLYGRFKVFAKIGYTSSIVIASQLVIFVPLPLGNGYGGAFLYSFILVFPTILMNLKVEPSALAAPSKQKLKVCEGLRLIARNVETQVFCLLVFSLGFTGGMLGALSNLQLSNIGADSTLATVFTVSRILALIFGTVVVYYSGEMIQKIGFVASLVVSFMLKTLFLFVYASITNPYYAIPVMVMDSLDFPIMWGAFTLFVDKISPPEMKMTMLGFRDALFHGFGRSLGSLVGGCLSSRYSIPSTLSMQGKLNCFMLLIFFIFAQLKYKCLLRNPRRFGPNQPLSERIY